jgi:hypothetical protein
LKNHRQWKDKKKEEESLCIMLAKQKAQREAEQAEEAQKRATEESRKSTEEELKQASCFSSSLTRTRKDE